MMTENKEEEKKKQCQECLKLQMQVKALFNRLAAVKAVADTQFF